MLNSGSRRSRLGVALRVASASVLVSGGLIAGATTSAQAWAPACDDGARSTAEYYASTGQFTTPRVYEWNDGTFHNKVELRYNAASRCAWGLYNGKPGTVYVDRSTNGGASWTGWMGASGPGGSVYTGIYNDYSPYVMRACANYGGTSRCTGWW